MIAIDIKIGDLFKYISEFEDFEIRMNEEVHQQTSLKVLSENSEWIEIEGIILKEDNLLKITFWNGSEIYMGSNHRFMKNPGNLIYAREVEIGDLIFTNNEILKVINIENLSRQFVYDICVRNKTSLYQCKLGIIHHNTLLACATAADQLFKKHTQKIVVTRPTIATEDNGFLPGGIEEKMDPWLVPIRHNFRKFYNKKEKWDNLEKDGFVEIIPLTYFRGQTFENAICIVDEYQNLTRSQLQMCIGRLGLNSRMIFCGDEQQIDLKNKDNSAYWEISKISTSNHVFVTTLLENHRHPAVAELLEMLNK